MLTYTTSLDLYQDLTNDDSSSNTTFFDNIFNEGIRKTISVLPFSFLVVPETDSTVADQQAYEIPANTSKIMNVTVTVGTQKYTPREAPDQVFWDKLNQTTDTTSDFPEWFYVQNKKLYLYPTPSSSGNTITYNRRLQQKKVSQADYTTGTITSIASGDTTVTGSSTNWNNSLVSRYIKITRTDATNSGDGQWYKIDSVTDATHLELEKNYEGTSISAASGNYIIGDISLIPEDYQIGPIYYAAGEYWAKESNMNKAEYYNNKYKENNKEMSMMYSSDTDNPVIDDREVLVNNPNLYVTK